MKYLIPLACVACLMFVVVADVRADSFFGITLGTVELGVSTPTVVASSARRYYRQQGRQAGRAAYRGYRAGGSAGLVGGSSGLQGGTYYTAGASSGLQGGASSGFSGGYYQQEETVSSFGASSGMQGGYTSSYSYAAPRATYVRTYARPMYRSYRNSYGSPCPNGNCP